MPAEYKHNIKRYKDMLDEVHFFRKYANAEVLGSVPARRFSEMADFLETFHINVLGMLVSTTYSEGYGIQALRGFYIEVV